MRAIQVALLVVCLQIGTGLIAVSGLFGNVYYEGELTDIDTPDNPEALSELEQAQTSINFLNILFDALTWGWIKNYFMPFYNQVSAIKGFIDSVIIFLKAISGILIGIAFIEFIRNRTEVL